MVKNAMSTQGISIVICTYNNCRSLDRTLLALYGQNVSIDTSWEVVVVNNNCTDETDTVVANYLDSGGAPGFRTVRETNQGLTHARRRGVSSTLFDWIAFVDDDCILSKDWVEQALSFAKRHTQCGAFGGRVILAFETPEDSVPESYGWLLARQDRGDAPLNVDFLVGAGLVIRREALIDTGWMEKPLLDDRMGRNLVSGGDMEIGLRIKGRGWELWYHPECRLLHEIPSWRTKPDYLKQIAFGLGKSQIAVDALIWNGTELGYLRTAITKTLSQSLRTLRSALVRQRNAGQFRAGLVEESFIRGVWSGLGSILLLSSRQRRALIGAAKIDRENPSH